jgi:hypothetical protein
VIQARKLAAVDSFGRRALTKAGVDDLSALWREILAM